MFGAIAGAASVFGNTPIDVVKTRMQGLEASKYSGTLDCFIQIWKNEGFSALVYSIKILYIYLIPETRISCFL